MSRTPVNLQAMQPATGKDVPELDVASLGRYLEGVMHPPPGREFEIALIEGGRSNPTYRISDAERSWVLRRPPYGQYVKSGHDMGREVTAMSALRDTRVPVPRVVAFCEDESVIGAPFYVMDMLDGRTFRTQDDTRTLVPAERARLGQAIVTTLATLHSVDPANTGLADWGRPDGYLSRQLSRWGKQWDAVATSERPQVAVLLRRLTLSMPTSSSIGIVHGDYKIDNIMFDAADPGKILGVLDWEMSTLGDTLVDLGTLLAFWDEPDGLFNPITQGATALEGFASPDDLIEMYASARDVNLERLDWYIVFSDFKVAVILEQIHRRFLEGTTTGDGFADIGAMVEPLLERALERAGCSSHSQLRGVD